MKFADGWWWPDGEKHMLEWLAQPRNRVMLNGRVAYQGRKQLACLQHCSRLKRKRLAVDVGAHVGLWSYNLKMEFLGVLAFEPMASHRECFMKNIGTSIVPVVLRPCALGEKEGRVTMWSNPTSSGDTWVQLKPEDLAAPSRDDVPMRTLDSFALEFVDFLKIDCEGYEENVIHGALATIEAWKPVICVEQKRDMAVKFGLKPQGAVTLLQHLGYEIAEEIGGDYIMVPV